MKQKKWYHFLWLGEILYLILGLCNILFAWLGMLFFSIPIFITIFGGNKAYCNRYCGRGQLLGLLGEKLKLSRNVPPPKFLKKRWFRYGFLLFFMTMFGFMLSATYQVFAGAPLQETIKLLWLFQLPWEWAKVDMVAPWIAQFAFWLFWRHANFFYIRNLNYDRFSPPFLVCLLSHGYNDPRNLPTKKQKGAHSIWKNKQGKLQNYSNY